MEQLGSADPQHIGGYRLLGRLGAGGMGEVYLARSERGRTVAVKLVREELAQQEEFRTRFRQEVQAAQRVGGLWTAPVLDADTEAAVPWVATGYIAGPSLHRVVTRDHGPLAERSVKVLASGLAYALKDIHAAGLVHRDLKPSNVLVTIDGPRVIDFGIARALETVAEGGLTRTGAVVGSPGFMAPEQVRGQRITPACDVFCLGSVLVFAATGRLPFGSPDSGLHALMYRIAEEEPDLSELPESIAELAVDCLRKDPARRPTPDQVLARVGAADTVHGGRARDPWLPGSLLAGLARHAVELLDHEHTTTVAADAGPGSDAGPDAGEPPTGAGGDGGAAPTPVRPALPPGPPAATEPPTPTPVPGPAPAPAPAYAYPPAPAPGYGGPPQGPGYGPPAAPYPGGHTSQYTYPHQPAPRRGRSGAVLVGAALVVALIAGGSVYAVMNQGDGTRTEAEETPGGDSGGGGSTGPDGGDGGTGTDKETGQTGGTDTPAGDPDPPATGGTDGPEGDEGQVPSEYLGTWQASFEGAAGTNTRTLRISRGKVGDTVMSLAGSGPDHDCRWTATLKSVGPPLELSTSDVISGDRAVCSPGEWSRLTLTGSGATLTRELVGSGGTPLTYRKIR